MALTAQHEASDMNHPTRNEHMGAAIKAARSIDGLHLIDTAAGTFTFVGRVPVALSIERIDGEPVDDELAAKVAEFGIGLFRKVVRNRSFATRDEAIAAAAELGIEVSS